MIPTVAIGRSRSVRGRTSPPARRRDAAIAEATPFQTGLASRPFRHNETRRPASGQTAAAPDGAFGSAHDSADLVDLARRRDQLRAQSAELQWDLGGLAYEMAIRDSIRVDVLVRKAAELQNVDAELSEVERILRLEETSTAGECRSCGAPHSAGAAYCWQCGQPLLEQVPSDKISTQFFSKSAGFNSIPIETKKTAIKTSRIPCIDRSTVGRCGVSATIAPSKNAPRASE